MSNSPTVGRLTAWLESWIPLSLAEDWDNVGLLLGHPDAALDSVITTLDVTPEVADEAIEAGAGLIISHHPILFRGANRLTGAATDPNAHLWRLARAGVAVYSPHTAYDSAEGGINDQLARLLGLVDTRPIRPATSQPRSKVVVFATESDRETVLRAAFNAGAGVIGRYSECSFATAGQGTFLGDETTNPTIGRAGRRETVDEWKIEVICEEAQVTAVLTAIREAHSYEEPAIDVIPLALIPGRAGSGRIGQLTEPRALGDLARHVATLLNAPGTVWDGPDPHRQVNHLAIACGAGDDFLADAATAGADVLLTGEARYHKGLEARSRGVGLILAGHRATDWVGVQGLRDRIAQAFPSLQVWASTQQPAFPRAV